MNPPPHPDAKGVGVRRDGGCGSSQDPGVNSWAKLAASLRDDELGAVLPSVPPKFPPCWCPKPHFQSAKGA